MQVNETRSPVQGRAAEPPAAARFGAALRAARDAAARRQGGGAEPLLDAPLALRRAATARAYGALRIRREVFREEERQGPAAPAERSPRPPSSEPITSAELRAVVRALPPAIEASRVRDGAPLTLSFGRSLSVDVRQAAGGVEVVLRPDARLARAAEAELPGVVDALRARGVRVARAEVRPRPHGGSAAVHTAR
jgi:hypothetical protein